MGSSSRVIARNIVVVLALLGALAALAVAGGGPAATDTARAQVTGAPGGLQATIRSTSHGIPHIVASDFPGLGFGYGYAAAKENICVLADMYVTVNGERSRWFGPDGSYSQGGNGTTNNNLNSDFFFQRIKDNGSIEKLLALDPPRGPRPEIKEAVRGYVAGYNKYLRDTGRRQHHRPALPGRGVGAPDHRDGRLPALLPARPDRQPGRRDRRHRRRAAAGRPRSGPADAGEVDEMIGQLGEQLPLGGIGSNAYGLGRDATDNGRGMVLGNPHFPWDGSERFFQAQLTIPGQINVERREPVRRAGDQHRPHRPSRVEPHGLHGVQLHPVRAEARAGLPHELRLRRPGAPDDGRGRDRDGEERRRRPGVALPHLYSISPRLRPHGHPGAAALPVDARDRVVDRRRERGQLPLPQPLLRGQPGAERGRAGRDHQAQPGRALGKHDRRRLRAATAYYADISVVPHVTNEKAATCNTALGSAAPSRRSACRCSTVRCRHASGAPTPMRWSPGIFGPSNLPSCAGTTSSSTPTTATGCRIPISRSRASTASSATSAPSARSARAPGS